MKFEQAYLTVLNFLTRALGVLFLLGGIGTAASIYFRSDDRWLRVAIAIFLVGFGTASIFAKAISPDVLAKIKRLAGRD
jgi:hypothetical protein